MLSDCKCVACGITATHFSLEYRNEKAKKSHLNLYGTNRERKALFTKDHIKPKSKGGADTLDNMQVMCEACNVAKGDRYDNP